jgi:hypothetical protein
MLKKNKNIMGQAVLHFEKHQKPTSGSLGNHIDRTEGKEYSYRHADLSKLDKNVYIKLNELCSMPYNQAILKRVEQGYNARNNKGELKAIRKDAVYSVNAVLSGSHEEMKAIEKDPILMDKWIEKNLEFCKNHFGKENITRFAVHLDEKTPHIHCSFVPITTDGRLSANDLIGTGKKLEEFQTIYAAAMADFGLERGVKSDRTHHTTEEYRQRERYKLDDNQEIIKALDDLKQSDVFNFKAKKEALNSMLANLILESDERTKKEIEALKTQILKLEEERFNLRMKENVMPIVNKFFKDAEKEQIFNDFSLVDYFFFLAKQGKLNFLKKSGNEFYFEDKDRKISVNEKGFFDHKSGTGGQKIKAVMEFEKIDWYKSMAYMSAFVGTDLSSSYKNIREERNDLGNSNASINAIFTPNNLDLIKYFNSRGISTEVLKKHTRQVHFQFGQKFLFGIGIKNIAGGWDIRNSIGKTKLHNSNFAEIGNGSKIAVFEGLTDMLSFLETLETDTEREKYKLICLNSVVNVDKFIENYQDFTGKIEVYLDAGKPADIATDKILAYFKDQAIDRRANLNINEHREGYKDLNDLLLDIKNYEIGLTSAQREAINIGNEKPRGIRR